MGKCEQAVCGDDCYSKTEFMPDYTGVEDTERC